MHVAYIHFLSAGPAGHPLHPLHYPSLAPYLPPSLPSNPACPTLACLLSLPPGLHTLLCLSVHPPPPPRAGCKGDRCSLPPHLPLHTSGLLCPSCICAANFRYLILPSSQSHGQPAALRQTSSQTAVIRTVSALGRVSSPGSDAKGVCVRRHG